MDEIDHVYTKEIVCPYCGYEHSSTDYRVDDHMSGSDNCVGCGEGFDFEADIEITWVTSRQLKKETPEA